MSHFKFQRNIAFLAVIIFVIKIIAWIWSGSIAIFTDALESTVNVITGFFGLYSVWLSARPRDRNHPYGHGKVEFISAIIEGTLIIIAGFIIIYQVVVQLREPTIIKQLDNALILLAITSIINFIIGKRAVQYGLKNRTITIEAAGKHLQTDGFSTLGIIVGLILMQLTGWYLIDMIIAVFIALYIMIQGYKVIRKSLAGIMDEADMKLLKKLIDFIQENRQAAWIDLHNLRMIQYGDTIHIDGHITLPWYLTVREAHNEIEELDNLIKEEFGQSFEFFFHVDGCQFFCCEICQVKNCPVRQHEHTKTIIWDLGNVLQNQMHNKPEHVLEE